MHSVNQARIRQLIRSRLWMLFIVVVAALLLSGCVNADLGIRFQGQSGGEIVQQLKLADQLTTFNGETTQQWFNRIKQRARRLQGKVKQSNQAIEVVIPFDNGADLEAKLNQFTSEVFKAPTASDEAEASSLVQSHLGVRQQNFLFLIRSRLTYDLDLRSLGVQSPEGNLLLSPEPLLDLTFRLDTPWGARSAQAPSLSEGVSLSPESGQPLVWHLQPGQLNHLEAVFWFPSPIGIGAVAIALVCAGGMYLKHRSPAAPVPT